MARNRKKNPNLGRKFKASECDRVLDLYKNLSSLPLNNISNQNKKDTYYSCLYQIKFITNKVCTIGKYVYSNEDDYYSRIFEENETYEAFIDNSRNGFCFDYKIDDYGHDKYGQTITLFVPFECVHATKLVKKV